MVKKVEEKSVAVVEKILTEVTPYEKQVADLVITNDDEYAAAGKLMNDIKEFGKTVTARKEKFTKPAYAVYKSLMDEFRPTEKAVDSVLAILKPKIVTYKREQDAAVAKEAARLQARLDKGTMRPDTVERKMDEIETVDNKVAGIKERTIKKVKIADAKAFPWGEYVKRPSVLEAIMTEVRKDALGNAAAGIAPKDIVGVVVYEETVI